jgi:hypothetical protein
LIVVAAFVVVVFALGVVLEIRDEAANQAFAEKARRLQIDGKPESFVREHFGEPAFVTRSGEDVRDSYHVLVYIPGPKLHYYPSYAKVTIAEKTGTVLAWGINSD